MRLCVPLLGDADVEESYSSSGLRDLSSMQCSSDAMSSTTDYRPLTGTDSLPSLDPLVGLAETAPA